MNRSFRPPETGMAGLAAVKQRQPQMTWSFRKCVIKEKEEEVGLCLEMRKREKKRQLLLQSTEADFESSLGSIEGSSPLFSMPAATPARKTGADKFLNSENNKNDYDWLLTPPGTPFFPSLEVESQKTVMAQLGTPKARPTALKSRAIATDLISFPVHQEPQISDEVKSRFTSGLSLPQLCQNLIKAAYDPHISGIYLHIESLNCGWGKIEEILRHILDFRKSGKFIIG